jgi:hypothetical protein
VTGLSPSSFLFHCRNIQTAQTVMRMMKILGFDLLFCVTLFGWVEELSLFEQMQDVGL